MTPRVDCDVNNINQLNENSSHCGIDTPGDSVCAKALAAVMKVGLLKDPLSCFERKWTWIIGRWY